MKSSNYSDHLYSRLNGLNVLIVEDNQVNQMLAKMVLDRWNCNVHVAQDGVIALNMLSEQEYDLMLLDIRLPNIDGYEVAQIIREKELNGYAHLHLPIIAMTASDLVEDNLKCFCVGMDDFISKPFEPDDLMRKIIKHLN